MFATAANVKESGPARWPPALLHDRFDYPVGGCVPQSTLSTGGMRDLEQARTVEGRIPAGNARASARRSSDAVIGTLQLAPVSVAVLTAYLVISGTGVLMELAQRGRASAASSKDAPSAGDARAGAAT